MGENFAPVQKGANNKHLNNGQADRWENGMLVSVAERCAARRGRLSLRPGAIHEYIQASKQHQQPCSSIAVWRGLVRRHGLASCNKAAGLGGIADQF
jgi:hypothetical protein